MCCRQHSAPPGGPYPHTVRSCAAPSSVSCPAPPPPPPPPPPRRVIPQTKKRRGGVQRGASGTVGPVGRPISHHGLVVVHLVPAAAHWAQYGGDLFTLVFCFLLSDFTQQAQSRKDKGEVEKRGYLRITNTFWRGWERHLSTRAADGSLLSQKARWWIGSW